MSKDVTQYGFRPDTPSCGDGNFDRRIQRQQTVVMEMAQAAAKQAIKPLTPSIPQPKPVDTNHIWDMIVLAARSSRYDGND